MATVAEVRIFPPIIAPYIPAKNIESVNNGIDIPFEMNELNDPSVITEVHVMITRQQNYKSLFNSIDYPLGIYPLTFTSAMAETGIIHVPASILNVAQLNFNEYYKMQLRFSAVTDPDQKAAGKTGSTLSENLLNESNLAQFSEWSSVGLLRFVAEPTFVLRANIQGNSNEMLPDNVNPYYLTSHYLDITGRFTKTGTTALILDTKTFNKADDKEYLSEWKIEIKDTSDNVLMDSGTQHVNFRGSNINEINYNAPFYFDNNENYIIALTITTANLYEETFEYLVAVDLTDHHWSTQNDVLEYTSLDSVIGKVNITFEAPSAEHPTPAGGKLYIRRSDRESNFTRWDLIWKYSINEPIVKDHPVVYDDFTIESGMVYKYAISYENSNGDVYTTDPPEGPILSIFDHAFLTGEGTQLCVKFNPNINSFKYNVSDNVVNTIGGQFPYITRNGNMKYRTFGLSGTIAYEMDERNQFTSRSDIYGEWINVYGSYFVNRYINQQNDRITQREFRELVMNYFYDDQPKLFRSTPEGNILVRITDVNLTPNQQLARMIYDFNCTVTEIGECTVDNYKLYNIQDFGDE